MKDARGGKEPSMGPMNSPWIEVPDDWLDDRYSRDDSYRAFQEYSGLKVKPEVINEYLIGNGILQNTNIEVVRFSAQEISGKLGIDATIGVTGNTRIGEHGADTVEIYRTIDAPEKRCHFDLISDSTVDMSGFGVQYYRRAFPLLDKLGIKEVQTMPTTGPEESKEKYQVAGAYVWSFYGYTNNNMPKTLEHYIDYLRNIRGIRISESEEAEIRAILPRMIYLAQDVRHGDAMGRKFLFGLDAHDKPTRSIVWDGTHHDIGNRGKLEMAELEKYLWQKLGKH
jgi:hypothetical protein